MPEIPDTESVFVASLAIAWEIVKITHVGISTQKDGEEGLKEITNAVLKSFSALTQHQNIE